MIRADADPEQPAPIRVRQDRDPEALGPLWRELHRHHLAVAPALAGLGGERDEDAAWAVRRAHVAEWLSQPGTTLHWVDGPDGAEPLGYCLSRMIEPPASWDWGEAVGVIEILVVAEGARGLGLGSRLLEAGRARLAELGARTVTVDVISANEGAAALYRRAGARPYLTTMVFPAEGTDGA